VSQQWQNILLQAVHKQVSIQGHFKRVNQLEAANVLQQLVPFCDMWPISPVCILTILKDGCGIENVDHYYAHNSCVLC